MKTLTTFTILILAQVASAETAIEKSMYSILEKNGAYIKYESTTANTEAEVRLESLSCTKTARFYGCRYVETARPFETGQLKDTAAEEMFNNIVSTGVKPLHIFGQENVTIMGLRCVTNTFVHSADSTTTCRALKPLFD